MWIFYQIIMLFCVVSFLKAQSPSPTENPECNGMTMVAKHLKIGLTAVPGISRAHCKPNKHCTGVLCSWSGKGVLEVDLHHCKDPVSYHVFFKYPAYGANENITLHQGDENTLVDNSPTATVKIKVTQLERTGNIITTSVVLEICFLGKCHLHPLITKQQFCVKMENCPGFNASLHHYKPCGYRPSGSPHQSPPYRSPSPDNFETPTSPWKSSSTDPSSDGRVHHHRADHRDDSSGSLSTGAIVGISAAGIVAILVVVGAIVYWKKYHHRSRLRAAYYNDISMHDPLYEDFGPEVA